MSVRFTGGNSGNREDASPPVPSSGFSIPVRNTETFGSVPSSVKFQATDPKAYPDHYQAHTPDFLPTGGTDATGSDLEQQDITGLGPNSGDQSVFRGAPNTGDA